MGFPPHATYVFALLLMSTPLCTAFLDKDDLCPLRNNKTGVCKELNNCPSAQYDLQVLRKQPGLCGFIINTPIICCNSTTQTTTEKVEIQTKPTISTTTKTQPNSDTTTVKIDNRLSVIQQKCQQFSNYVYRNQTSPTLLPGIIYEVINSCNVKEHFEHGEVISGEYPHLVSIGYSSVNNPIYKCTGALISEEYVLTTASCTSTNAGVPQVVRLGTTIKQPYYFEYPEVQYIEIKEFIKHPRYDQFTKKNDIALIKLNRKAVINALVRPACLPEDNKIDETIVVGYGSLGNFGEFQKDIKADVFRLNQNRECLRMFSRRNERSSFCGRLEKNQCVLDEGAPLQIVNRSPYCTYTIVGLLSSWQNCDFSNPVFITDVSKYIRWIEKNIWV